MFYSNTTAYQKLVMPVFLRKHKEEVDGYTFIKTILCGSSNAHILKGNDDYYMCVSRNDHIAVEEDQNYPVGYKRSSLIELENMAESYNKLYNKENKNAWAGRRKWKKVVERPKYDYSLPWNERMKEKTIINILTKEEIDLSLPRLEIMKKTGLSSHLLNTITLDGNEVRGWCYKGKRLDNQSWEDFLNNQTNQISEYNGIHFVKDGNKIPYITLRDTSQQIGISYETLRKAIVARDEEVNGYKIIYSSSFSNIHS